MNAFEAITLSQTEQDILVDILANPTVVKYFAMIANDIAQGIITIPLEGRTPEQYVMAMAREQGKLEVVERLLTGVKGTLGEATT